MSKPSFSNIDLWLFEYAEGNLTDDQVANLELFIIQHPELDVDRDMWEMAHVPAAAVAFDGEAALIKRKPVGAYWSIGVGAAAMCTLLFIGYTFFTHEDEVAANLDRLSATEEASELYASNLILNTANERALKEEVADLRNLVASLESELYKSRGNSRNSDQIVSIEGLYNNADQTGIDNGNFRELRALGNYEIAAFANSSTNQIIIASNDQAIGNDVASNNGLMSNDQATNDDITGNNNAINNGIANNHLISSDYPIITSSNTSTTGVLELSTAVAASQEEDTPIANTQEPINSLKPNALQEIVKEIQPVSREIFTDTEASNSEDQATNSTHRNATLSVDYEDSYKYKFSRFVRNVRRMANNPIALKNHRDAYHNVPGMTSTDLNFGATGTMIAPRFQAMSRLQNRGTSNELFSNQIGFDGYVFDMRGGIGVQMTQNYYNNGGIQSREIAITYSPKFSVNPKLSIEPAFRFKMGNKMLDADRMEGASQVEYIPGNAIDYYKDGTTPVGSMLWYRDLGLGLNVNTQWFYASAQVDNVFRHGDNLYSNNLKEQRRAGTYFVASIGTDWESNDSQWETQRARFSISPYVIYRNYENINELWAGANFRAYWLTMGFAVSSNMDPSASMGVVSSNKRFSLTYNADYSQSSVTNERSLSHQLTLRLVGKQSRVGRRH